MNLLELLTKTGKGIRTGAKDTGKALETTGKVIAHEIPEVVTVAAEVAPVISPVLAVAGSIAAIVNGKIARPVSESFPASLPVSRAMSDVFQTSITGDEMNPLESFAITMVLGILQSVVKNPAHKAVLENQLVGVADQIYAAYGLVPPAPAPAASAPALTPNSH